MKTLKGKRMQMKTLYTAIAVLVLAALIGLPIFFWYGCRIEPRNGQIAVLIKKTGRDLPGNEIIASSPESKGIQLEVLGEGRYFRNPYTWEWEYFRITDIPAGKFGVLVRKFGKDLPEGSILAPGPEYKGIVSEVLGTGKHRINPYAYDVQVYDDIKIMPGNVGVITNMTGGDVFSGAGNDLGSTGGFLADPSRKGVQKTVLKEGTHRINPFLCSVAVVNIQSQRYEFSGANAIGFLTMDGFNISIEGTVEFNIQPDAAPRLSQEVGDMEDIMKKLILPSVSGFARIEGSKKSATEFIVGESRQVFQNRLEEYLRKNCSAWGVSINSVLIRDIIPPQDIALIIRNRELAQQDARKFKDQIEQAKSAAALMQQQKLAEQNRARVEAETLGITAKIRAEQEKMQKLIAAGTELKTAGIRYQTAESESKARLTIAEAERQVIASGNRSETEVLRRSVEAYGGGEAYLRALLFEKVSPRIESIMTNGGKTSVFGLPLSTSLKPAAEGAVK